MSHSKNNSDFFSCQKKIVWLWCIWGAFIMIFAAQKSIFGYFQNSVETVWTWIGIYLGSIYTLITGSTFFRHSLQQYVLKDKIYFRLAYFSSCFYLFGVTTIIFFMPIYVLNKGGDRTALINSFNDSETVFKVLLPIQLALLGYFFFKKERNENSLE